MTSTATRRQGDAAIEVSNLRTTYGPTVAVERHRGLVSPSCSPSLHFSLSTWYGHLDKYMVIFGFLAVPLIQR